MQVRIWAVSPPLKDVVVLPVGVCNLPTLNILSELITCGGVEILIIGKLGIESARSTEERAFWAKMTVFYLPHLLVYFYHLTNILYCAICL